MSRRTGKTFVKWTGWNMKASDAKKKSPIALAIRRVRQVALLLRVRPDVFLAVEVGSPAQAISLSKRLKRARVPLRRVPNGGGWRYAWVNPKYVHVIASGIRSMTHRWQGDNKPTFWFVAVVRGYRCLFIAAHLENLGPTRVKVQQAGDVETLAAHLRDRYDIGWDKVFIYVDGNDPTGAVRRKFEDGPLCIVERKARRKSGTGWRSHNQWKRRLGKARKVSKDHESIDLMLNGRARRYSRVVQHDTHTSSDHDAKTAVAVFN